MSAVGDMVVVERTLSFTHGEKAVDKDRVEDVATDTAERLQNTIRGVVVVDVADVRHGIDVRLKVMAPSDVDKMLLGDAVQRTGHRLQNDLQFARGHTAPTGDGGGDGS